MAAVSGVRVDHKRVNGGLLIQGRDTHQITETDLTVVSKRKPDATETQDLMFAWSVAQFVKSTRCLLQKPANHRDWRGPDEQSLQCQNCRH